MSQVMGGLKLMCKYTFSLGFFYILLLVPLQTYICWEKNWALLIDLLMGKNNVFAKQLPHTKMYI